MPLVHDAVLQEAAQFDNVFPYLRTPLPGAPGDGTSEPRRP